MTKGMRRGLNIEFRIWIYKGDVKLLGKGRVEILERIKRTGSILSASKEMKMSYRQAWQMVKEMNERAVSPLVEKKPGGKNGGGAVLTEAGEKAIVMFRKLEKRVEVFIKKNSERMEL